MPEVLAPLVVPSTAEDITAYVKVSVRAKRPRLEICPYGTVTLVAPRRFAATHWEPFIGQNTQWIEHVLRKIDRQRRDAPDLHTLVPNRICLPTLNETWRVTYDANQRRGICAQPDHDTGQLTLRDNGLGEHVTYLRSWIRKRATQTLSIRLEQAALQTGLRYTGVSIRSQKTRWGSCTRKGLISLNQNLLFLDTKLTDYLLLHELCHTVHMSHSARYWALVKRYEPNFRNYERQLHEATGQIPIWAVKSGYGLPWTQGAVIRLSRSDAN